MGGSILLWTRSRRGLDWAPTYEIHLLYVMSKFQFLKVLTLCTAVMQHVDESSFRHSCVVIQLKEDEIHEAIHKHEARSTNIDHYLSDLSVSPILLTRCHWWENHAHVQGMWQSQWIPTKMWIWPTWQAWSRPTLLYMYFSFLMACWCMCRQQQKKGPMGKKKIVHCHKMLIHELLVCYQYFLMFL